VHSFAIVVKYDQRTNLRQPIGWPGENSKILLIKHIIKNTNHHLLAVRHDSSDIHLKDIAFDKDYHYIKETDKVYKLYNNKEIYYFKFLVGINAISFGLKMGQIIASYSASSTSSTPSPQEHNPQLNIAGTAAAAATASATNEVVVVDTLNLEIIMYDSDVETESNYYGE
jgi:hypothetical protein